MAEAATSRHLQRFVWEERSGKIAEQLVDDPRIETPAFVYDRPTIRTDIAAARAALRSTGTDLLFAMKAFSSIGGLRCIADQVDGLHASSLFEARLARTVLDDRGIIHLTSPGLREDEASEIFSLCDLVSFNSLSQWDRYRSSSGARLGLRVNPELSFVSDPRYDPCAECSKLGAPISQVSDRWRQDPDSFTGLSGLLIHTNCDDEDFAPLLATVNRLTEHLGPLLERIRWVNLGGGYLFQTDSYLGPLETAIGELTSRGIRTLMEPGSSIIRRAGFLVATVVDRFKSGGRQLAVLDTSINHLPEVFEYDFEPDVAGHAADAPFAIRLAGGTCLAGDIFGDYQFAEPLEVGSRVVFENVGSYSTVKANTFNGLGLPGVYLLDGHGALELESGPGYEGFLARCGG